MPLGFNFYRPQISEDTSSDSVEHAGDKERKEERIDVEWLYLVVSGGRPFAGRAG